jgi:ELWxxDGT repeat protein
LSALWTGGDAAVAEITAVGSTVYFAACDPAVGRSLYKTDGTVVTLVKDFVPAGLGGPANSCDPANGPSQLTDVNGKLYLVVDDGINGHELWTSDGSTSGTVMIEDLNPGPEPSDPSINAESCGRSACRVLVPGGFVFTAQTADAGRELWFCNGSSITQVGDPDPGPRGGVSSDRLALSGNRVYFAGSDDDGNGEPWAAPLTPTLMVKDARVGESAGMATLTVRLLPANAAGPVSVQWSTLADSAGAPFDFTASGGTVNFGPGVTTATIQIPLTGDSDPEGDESFAIVLSSAVNAQIGTSSATVTVHDDDGKRVSLGLGPGGPLEGYTVPVRLTVDGPHGPIEVDYRTVAVTAREVSDFTRKVSHTPAIHEVTHTPIVIPATTASGPHTVAFNVPTINDQTHELYLKELRVELFNPLGGSLVTRTISAFVENDDVPGPDGPYFPSVSLGSRTVAEADTFATFTATLSKPSEFTARLYWNAGIAGEDPPAEPGLDYRATSGFFVFRPGETTHDVSVEVFEDAIDEPDEKYWVDLDTASAVGAGVGVGRGVGIVTDDDTGTLSVANPSPVAEGDAGPTNVTFNVTLSTPYYRDFTIDYTTANNTALSGSDYTAVSGTLLFPKGTTSRTITVAVLGDVVDEANETFGLVLSNSTGPGFSDSRADLTITDDDTTVSVAAASGNEGNTGTSSITFTVTTPEFHKADFTVDYETVVGGVQPATAGVDYVATSGTLVFPQGVKSKTFTVTVNADTIDEPAENFLVRLSNSTGPLILNGEAIGTINDNDTTSVTINNVSVPEGNSGTTNAVFTVSLSVPYHRDITLDWTTAAGTTNPATEGVDYLAANGTLTVPAGATSATLDVPVVGDTLAEGNESFAVVLSNSSGPNITDTRGDGTITNDDTLTLSVADASAVEGNSGNTPLVFTLTLSGDHEQPISVTVATSGGGPTPPAAAAGSDFVTKSATVVSFAAGVLSQTVSVDVVGDTVAEAANESFGLSLSNVTTGVTLARTKALGIILDDDSNRTLSLSPLAVSVNEPLAGSAEAVFTVALSAAAGRTVTVDYVTANGTALSGSDYTTTTGTLSFEPGDLTKTIAVPVLADAVVEGPETFTLTLSGPTNGTIGAGAGSAVATIADSISQVAMGFYTLNPCRAVDTREAAFGATPLPANVPRTFTLAGTCGIPLSARALSVNVTVSGATSAGNVRLYPGGTTAPNTSTINFLAALTRANNAIALLGTGGTLSVLLAPTGSAHVIIDVNGYME